jgi:hypothetical protein
MRRCETAFASAREALEHLGLCQEHILFDGHVREQVELLEDHSDSAPLFGCCDLRKQVQSVLVATVADIFSGDFDGTAVDGFEVVDAVEQGALPRTGWTDDADHLTALHLQGDVFEDELGTRIFWTPGECRRWGLGSRGCVEVHGSVNHGCSAFQCNTVQSRAVRR